MNAGPILVTLARGEVLALGVNDRGLAFADRNLAFASAASHAESKNCRAEENQDFFHGDATRVYPLNDPTCTDRTRCQLVHKSHTPHKCAAAGLKTNVTTGVFRTRRGRPRCKSRPLWALVRVGAPDSGGQCYSHQP